MSSIFCRVEVCAAVASGELKYGLFAMVFFSILTRANNDCNISTVDF